MKKYTATYEENGVEVELGKFNTLEEAWEALDNKCLEICGDDQEKTDSFAWSCCVEIF